MSYIKLILSISIFLSVFINEGKAQTKEINQIDSIMKYSSKTGVFNGNVLVSKKNKIIYDKSFGYTDEKKINNLTANYRFNIGSITKEFSAVTLMQLKEKGKLKLNDTVSKFLPELPKWANKVTIKDLLQYTSGIPNVNWKSIKNDKDLYDGLMQIDTLDFEPGTNYDYNNNNIFLRQFIIDRMTKMPYKDYVEKYIFNTCNLSSALLTPFQTEENIAKGYNVNLVQDKPDLPITGGTYITTSDLLKWSSCLYNKKVINKKSIYELGQHFNLPETQSALGQAKFSKTKLIQHIHDGRAGNYEAIIYSNIEKKFTIILLDNNYNGKIIEISEAIAMILND